MGTTKANTIEDLDRLNKWRKNKGYNKIKPKKKTIKAFEKAVAIAMVGINRSDMPELIRTKEYYWTLLTKFPEKLYQ